MHPRYVLFCPFDTPVNYPLSLSVFADTDWPYRFYLKTFFSYGISSAQGQLVAIVHDSVRVDRLLHSCQLGATNALFPNSLGRQRVQFPVRFDGQTPLGPGSFPEVRIEISFQAVIAGFDLDSTTTACSTSNSRLTCSYTSTSMTITATLKPANVLDSFILAGDLVLVFPIRSTFGVVNFGPTKPFILALFVPALDGSSRNTVYGSAYDASTYEQCDYMAGMDL